ncbi:unnamed protein product, partial [Closterium sp. NIES-54]
MGTEQYGSGPASSDALFTFCSSLSASSATEAKARLPLKPLVRSRFAASPLPGPYLARRLGPAGPVNFDARARHVPSLSPAPYLARRSALYLFGPSAPPRPLHPLFGPAAPRPLGPTSETGARPPGPFVWPLGPLGPSPGPPPDSPPPHSPDPPAPRFVSPAPRPA